MACKCHKFHTPAEGGTATLRHSNEQLDDPGTNVVAKISLNNHDLKLKPAKCSRPQMEHAYEVVAGDQDQSLQRELDPILRLVKPSCYLYQRE